MELIKRIDISTLLKEIDVDEMKLLAQNNLQTQLAFQGMLNHWDKIQNRDELI